MKLIDKDVLVAEIEKLKKSHDNWSCMGKRFHQEHENLLSFIDTIEVKDVDLDKEIDDIFQKYKNGYNGLLICKKSDFSVIAKHFFELGLKAQKEEIV